MGWQGDHIMTRPGVWVWKDENGVDLGVAAIWWSAPGGQRYVNEFRVNKIMDTYAAVEVSLDPGLGPLEGDSLVERRNHFKNTIWPAYKNAYNPVTAGMVAREWTGIMQADGGFDLSGASSTSYGSGGSGSNQI